MSDFIILLMPKDNYFDWLNQAKDYIMKFGANITSDPESAGRYMTPRQVVVVAGLPNAYPAQGDIQAWFRQKFPSVRVDYIPCKNAAEFKAALDKRVQSGVAAPPAPAATLDWGRVWPEGKCLVGLHGRADGRMEALDFEVVRQARIESVKLTSTAAPEDIDRLYAIRPGMFIMVRLFADFRNRVVNPNDFAYWVQDDMRRFYERGVRYYEIHNEPNLKLEGWGQSWKDGAEFGQWWLTVRNRLKTVFPEARFGWPGLSPDGFPMPERTNDIAFLKAAAPALQASDFVCLHCYWRDDAEMDSEAGGRGYVAYRKMYPEKLLFVSEFSNPRHDVPHHVKGQQYVRYYQNCRNFAGLGAVYAFLSSASAYFPHEAWRLESGEITDITRVVGARHAP